MTKKTPTLMFLALAFLGTLGLTQNTSKQAWSGRTERVDGVPVVKNPATPIYGVCQLDLAEDLTLGNEKDKNAFFYKVRSVKADRDGNILVLDSGNFRVQVFDKTGHFIRTFGRQGQGPGEFQLPVAMELDAATDRIIIRDVASQGLCVFEKEGRFLHTIRVSGCRDFVPLESGAILAVVETSDDAKLTSQTSLSYLDQNGKVKAIIETAPMNLFMQHEGEGTLAVSTGHEFSLFLSRIGGGACVYGYSKNYTLTIIDQTGKVVRRFEKEGPKPAFTAEELKSFKRIPVPEQKPFFYALLADSVGRIYIRRVSIEDILGRGPVDLKPVEAEVFSKDGYYLFNTTLPPNTGQITDGMIYSYTVNEETGEERVKRFRIKNWPDLPIGVNGTAHVQFESR